MTIATKIAKQQKMQMEKLKYLNDSHEARKARVNNTAFRKEILEKQTVYNYSSEYNRLRAHLLNTALPAQTQQNIKSRTDHLKALGAQALNSL